MSPFLSLLRIRVAAVRNRCLDLHKDALAKALVVILGLILITGVAHAVSFWSFRFIEGFPAIGTALSERLLSLLFLILLVMVGLSTAVIAYASLYLAAETEFLFQNPAPPRLIFFLKLCESVAFSAWATLVLGLPVLVAFGRARKAGAIYYLESGAILLAFLTFCGFAGAAFMLVLLEVVRRWTWRRLLVIGTLLVGIPGWLFLRSFEFAGLAGDESLQVLDRFTAGIAAIRSPFFPGHSASAAVVASSGGHREEALFQGGLLLANTLIFLPLFAIYGRYRYGRRWLLARDPALGLTRVPAAVPPPVSAAAATPLRAPKARDAWFAASSPATALFWKDFLTFVRDPAQISQFILFLLLLAVYVASLLRIPSDLFGWEWKLLVYFGNLGAISLVLSSFTSRFLFPLLSLEGKSFWVVGLAPVERRHLVLQKAIAGFLVIGALGLAAAIASSLFLGFRGWLFAGSVYTILLAGFCLTSLATGLGAAYPNMDEDNPARIAVGMGGTLNFFASAAAIIALVAIEGVPYILFRPFPPGVAILGSHLAALAFAGLLSFWALRLGQRTLEDMEF